MENYNSESHTLEDVKEAHRQNPEQKQDFICRTDEVTQWLSEFRKAGFTIVDRSGIREVHLDDEYVGDLVFSSQSSLPPGDMYRIPRRKGIWDRDRVLVETPRLESPVLLNRWRWR